MPTWGAGVEVGETVGVSVGRGVRVGRVRVRLGFVREVAKLDGREVPRGVEGRKHGKGAVMVA